jgi:hypothetical protein
MGSLPKAALAAQLARLRVATGMAPLELLNALETGRMVVSYAVPCAHAQEMELVALRLRVDELQREIDQRAGERCLECADSEQMLGEARIRADRASELSEALLGAIEKAGAPIRYLGGDIDAVKIGEWLEQRLDACARYESELETLQEELEWQRTQNR